MRTMILILLLSTFSFAGNGPSKEQLHEVLLKTLPENLCKEGTVCRECYSVNKQECKVLVSKLVTPCFNKFENELDGNINREKFINIADKIGSCVGDDYYAINKNQGKVDLVCYVEFQKLLDK